MVDQYSLFGLALSGFISSTLLPGGSEALFVYLIHVSRDPAWVLFLVVTVFNALGSWLTFGMGWYANRFKRLQFTSDKHPRLQLYLHRYGVWALFFAWLPIIGDPFCLLAGWLRLSVLVSLVVILLGKAARYASLWFIAEQIVSL